MFVNCSLARSNFGADGHQVRTTTTTGRRRRRSRGDSLSSRRRRHRRFDVCRHSATHQAKSGRPATRRLARVVNLRQPSCRQIKRTVAADHHIRALLPAPLSVHQVFASQELVAQGCSSSSSKSSSSWPSVSVDCWQTDRHDCCATGLAYLALSSREFDSAISREHKSRLPSVSSPVIVIQWQQSVYSGVAMVDLRLNSDRAD